MLLIGCHGRTAAFVCLAAFDLQLYRVFSLETQTRNFSLSLLDGWHSQYGQDQKIMRWLYNEDASDAAHDVLHGREHRQGVFVELGAGDGLEGTNTLAFEEKLGWTGLLIEPVQELFDKLQVNRKGARCVHSCVAGTTGLRSFAESGLNSGTTGRLIASSDLDKLVDMTCQTLGDLIDTHLGDMGRHIDYLSLDTEGTELEILWTFDFNRHQVDVISIEIDDALPQKEYHRMTRLLKRKGFRFLERMLLDEIWVRKAGLQPDPTCTYPLLQLEGTDPAAGVFSWGSMRKALTSLSTALLDRPLDTWDGTMDVNEQLALNYMFYKWAEADLQDWERACPAGMLTLGIAFVILHNRFSGDTTDSWGLAKELRQHSVFHHTERVLRLERIADFGDQVRESELLGKPFVFRFPLGKSWHSTRFEDLLEARWPIFGFLDVAAKRVANSGHLIESSNYRGVEERRPLFLPTMRCQLEFSDLESVRIMLKTPLIRRGKHRSVQSLLLNADTCNLLGAAAGNFHQARFEMARLLRSPEAGEFRRFDLLHNWTAACSDRGAHHLCREADMEHCAALQDDQRRISKSCLRVRPALSSKPSTLRIRRRIRLQDTRAGFWIEEGERLFREFVARYDLQVALWAAGQVELAPLKKTGASDKAERLSRADEAKHRETMFGILHSLQQDLFFPGDVLPAL